MKITILFTLIILGMSVAFSASIEIFAQVSSAPQVVDDGSIKGYFLANNGGVDFSIDPANPNGDDDGEPLNYGLLASIMSASEPSPTDQIRAAQTNTDIDVNVIREAAKESLGDLIFFRTYLAIGDTEAARVHYEKISRQMIDTQMEVGFTAPIEQVTLVESESNDEDDQSNSGKRFSELEGREQQAIEDGRLPPSPTYTTLNASEINELALDVRGKLGGMVGANSPAYGDPAEVTAYANQMAESLLKIYYSMNFAVPLEQVQIIGSTAPYIEELKQAILGISTSTPTTPPSTPTTPPSTPTTPNLVL